MLLSEIVEKYCSLDIVSGLDLKNPFFEVKNASLVEKSLENYLNFAKNHVKNPQITLKSEKNTLILQDPGTILDKSEKKPFENEITSVKSRVGFGTTLKISLN